MRRSPFLTILLLSLPLAACETLGLTSPKEAVDPGPICPSTAVLADADTVTKLKTGTPLGMQNQMSVVFSAEMSQAKLNCNYNRTENKLSLDLSFAVKANRGPAATGADPQLDFFVAVIDADNNVIAKNIYHAQPDMAGRANNMFTESVSNYPVPLAMDKHPYDYEILTGFQLSPDELAYNRAPRPLPAPRSVVR
jgi:hypothetical protein